eukprot:5747466-Prymnesium_polylepis.1
MRLELRTREPGAENSRSAVPRPDAGRHTAHTPPGGTARTRAPSQGLSAPARHRVQRVVRRPRSRHSGCSRRSESRAVRRNRPP